MCICQPCPVQALVSTLPRQKHRLSQPSTCRSKSAKHADITAMAECMCIVILSSIMRNFIMAVISSCNMCSYSHCLSTLYFLAVLPHFILFRLQELKHADVQRHGDVLKRIYLYVLVFVCMFIYLLVHLYQITKLAERNLCSRHLRTPSLN